MASTMGMYLFINCFVCISTRGMYNVYGNYNPAAKSGRIESGSFTEELDNMSNISQSQLPSSSEGINSEQLNSLNIYDDGLTAYDQIVLGIVERQLSSIHHGKRQGCELPKNMIQDFTKLYRQLNTTLFYGTKQDETPRVNIPPTQLKTCPTSAAEILNSDLRNTVTVCPWEIMEIDLGPNSFPRYYPDIGCLCARCFGIQSSSCDKQTYVFDYFQFQGCENGFAIFVRKTAVGGSACICTRAAIDKLTPDEDSE